MSASSCRRASRTKWTCTNECKNVFVHSIAVKGPQAARPSGPSYHKLRVLSGDKINKQYRAQINWIPSHKRPIWSIKRESHHSATIPRTPTTRIGLMLHSKGMVVASDDAWFARSWEMWTGVVFTDAHLNDMPFAIGDGRKTKKGLKGSSGTAARLHGY